jgi:type II secretory pathway predicted ATPase ExeA
MDVVAHFSLSQRPFQRSGAADAFSSAAFSAAREAVLQAIACGQSPVLLFGEAGSGKSALLETLAGDVAASGRTAQLFLNPRLAHGSDLTGVDVALVDEFDTLSAQAMADVVQAAGRSDTLLIIAGLDPAVAPGRSALVGLDLLRRAEAVAFLQNRSGAAGRPDLIAAAAVDAIVDNAGGNPRLLQMLAGKALMHAMLDGERQVLVAHVEEAIRESVGALPGRPRFAAPALESTTAVEAAPPAPTGTVFAAAAAAATAATVPAEGGAGQVPPADHTTPAESLAPPVETTVAAADNDIGMDWPFPPRASEAEADVPPRRSRWMLAAGSIAVAGLGAVAVAIATGRIDTDSVRRWGAARTSIAAAWISSLRTPASPQQTSAPVPVSVSAADSEPMPPATVAENPGLTPDAASEAARPGFSVTVAAPPTGAAAEAEPAASAPPVPGPGTPGFQAAQPRQPSIAAAQRAGIPVREDAQPARAEATATAPLELFRAAPPPIASTPQPPQTVDVDGIVDNQ